MKPHKRPRGQTAIYEDWEWIYNPRGLTDSTWTQIAELRKLDWRVRVIQWPEGTAAMPPSWLGKKFISQGRRWRLE